MSVESKIILDVNWEQHEILSPAPLRKANEAAGTMSLLDVKLIII